MLARKHLDQLRIAASRKVRERDYWLDKLSGELVKSGFPYDYKTSDSADKSFEAVNFNLTKEISSSLIKLSTGSDVRLFIILAAGLTLLIHKYSGSSDIVIGSPILKPDRETAFINTVLALRNRIEGDMTFRELILQVKQTVVEAGENRNYPIEVLLEQLDLPFPGGDFPLFDVALLFEEIHARSYLQHIHLNMVLSFMRADGCLEGQWEYNALLYDRSAVERLITHFTNLLHSALANPGIKVSQIDILSKEEKRELLLDFNRKREEYPGNKTIQCLFDEQAKKSPDNTALVGTTHTVTLKNRDRSPLPAVHLTYRELSEECDRLAGYLCQKGKAANDLLGIIVDRSLEMIIGILGILKAGAGYVPLNPNAPEARTVYILEECNIEMLLSTSGLYKNVETFRGLQVETIFIDEIGSRHQASGMIKKQRRGGSVAYVIFTSGSTGNPKGLPITHANFCPLLHWGYAHMRFVPDDRFIQNLSYYFDWSVWEIFMALTSGASLYMIGEEILLNPEAQIEFIRKNDITALHITPSQCFYLLNVGDRLETLKYLIIGAEKLTYDLVKRSTALIRKECRIFNMYGPTEATILSAVLEIDRQHIEKYERLSNIPIGEPIANLDLFILDKNRNLCPVNISGELYIRGSGLAAGYINSPALSAEKFVTAPAFSQQPQPATSAPDIPLLQHSGIPTAERSEARLYRTGDLARWLPDGNIEFLGRQDFQVKIRGNRIELGEIENRLLKHKDIKEGVVIARENEMGEKYLCAYIVTRPTTQSMIGGGAPPQAPLYEEGTEGLRQFLSRSLPDYMIPSHFVVLDRIPLNSNGKIDLKALPVPAPAAAGKDYIPPRSEIEAALVEIWSEVLNRDRQSIGIDDNFFDSGGHSLKATIILSKIHKKFNVRIPLKELFKKPTVRALADYIKESKEEEYAPIEPAEEKEYHRLSSAQKRLYLLQQFEVTSTGYNLPYFLVVTGKLDMERVEDTFRQMIERHESLRTSFRLIEEEPVQQVHRPEDIQFEIEYHEEYKLQNLIHRFIRPFDLSRAPLLRMGLMNLETNKYLLMLDMHHIISDGTSMDLFVKEFVAIYKGEVPARLRLYYKDYAEWQQYIMEKDSLKTQEQYWLNEFWGEIPVLNLPTDYARPKIQSFAGNRINFDLSKGETERLQKLSRAEGVTLYMMLVAVINVLLSKLSSQEDIVIGTVTAGRSHVDLEAIIGMFVNTVVLRNFPVPGKTFKEFLFEVREGILKAFENQEYQFEDLVERVSVNRDTSRNPLFDVMFVLQNMEQTWIDIPGLEIEPYEHGSGLAKFDLSFFASELEGILYFGFEFCTKLFKRETIERFIRYFKKVVVSVLDNPGETLSHIEIISEQEKQQVLYDFNDTAVDYPGHRTVHWLFAEQAKMKPDRVAVGFEDERLTYKELDEESDRLGSILRGKGVKGDDVVGIMLERSPQMVSGLLGILKAGGAYLPVDPGYPKERQQYVLEDSNVKILITSAELFEDIENLKSLQFEMIFVDESGIGQETSGIGSMPYANASENLAYILYTSGSTGRPKGVMVDHRNIVRLVKNTNYIEFWEEDSILQTGALDFDASTFEIWGSLLNGIRLYLAETDEILNAIRLEQLICRYKVTTIWMTSPLFNQLSFLNIGVFAGLRNLLVGGDVLSPYHINRVRLKYPELNMINGYGPTENTTFSTTFLITGEYEDSIPIGKPIANSTAYIIDKANKLLPLGVPGELCVGGAGVSRGYLNDPELSVDRFIDYKSQARLYRTGDMARWLPYGKIEFLGRIDQQVKIRGFRIELSEIESRLLDYEDINDAVVIVREYEFADKSLCAYFVSKKNIIAASLRKYLSRRLPDYMIPLHFVRLDAIPLTANGKVDRRVLPKPKTVVSGEDYIAPRNQVEENLIDIWAGVLNISPASIGIDENFFELGGHSLKAAIVLSKIHKVFNVVVPLKELFKTPTVRALAKCIKGSKKEEYTSIESAEEKEYYRLSSAQERLYLLQQFEATSTGYNLPYFLVVTGKLDMERAEDTFRQMIERHESLRTSFRLIEEEPVQQVHRPEDIQFEVEYHEDYKLRNLIHRFIRPFDLSRAPLLRVGLMNLETNKYLLMLDMHHIISDGTSMDLFVKEFMAIYKGEVPARLKLHYKDYAEWQQYIMEKDSLRTQEQYWLNEFRGEIPVLNLRTDYARPKIQSFAGSAVRFRLSREETGSLQQVVRAQEVTLYMMLVAVINVLLSKLSSQEDIVIGTVTAGRSHVDLESIIGMFVNTLALRNYPSRQKTFKEFLFEVRERTLKAFESQEYQFDDLVERVSATRDTARNPLFDVMFVLQNMEQTRIEIPGLKIGSYEYDKRLTKFDLSFFAGELDGMLTFSLEYCTILFKKETIERFIRYLRVIIASVIKDPAAVLGEIDIISAEEKQQILYEFNNKETGYPRDRTIQQLFAEQAAKTPDKVALVGGQQRNERGDLRKEVSCNLTYRELNDRTDRLAYYLYRHGGDEKDLLGIMVERSIEMIIGILGILKAGAGYVPLNPGAPEARNAYILDECNIKVLLTTRGLYEAGRKVDKWVGETLFIDDLLPVDGQAQELPRRNLRPPTTSVAYVIFTSGSTGQPKGVAITHANVCPLLHWGYKHLGFVPADRFIQNLSYYFDWSVWEIFMALTSGASLYMIGEEILLNPAAQVAFIRKNDITVLHITPTQCLYLVNVGSRLETLNYLIIGAEKLTYDLVKRSGALIRKSCRMFNMYGPTEATIMSAVLEIDRRDMDEKYERLSSIPIGEPIASLDLLILDSNLNLCPVNITGELYIRGGGLAGGYINSPALSAERFVTAPAFSQQPKPTNSAPNIPLFQHSSIPTVERSEARCYRTGDLARWLPDGNIEFLGRQDHQVKIRGYRIELGEIENQLLAHKDIKEGVVITKENEAGEKYLCAYIVAHPTTQSIIEGAAFPQAPPYEEGTEGLRQFLSRSLPDYMVPSHFVVLDRIPLNPNGKIDLNALPEPQELRAGREYAAPRNEIEKKLAVIWQQLLKVERIGINENFFDIGGHSLKVLGLVNAIQKEFNVKIDFQDIFRFPSIAAIHDLIRKRELTYHREIERQPEKDYYELSYTQKRLWLLYEFEPDSPAFNLGGTLTLYEKVDENIIKKVLEKLVNRHESFRTCFRKITGEPVQIIQPESRIDLEVIDLSSLSGEKLTKTRQRLTIEENRVPFDLKRAPLLRTKLIKCKEEEYDLLFTMHHIISDGWSLGVLEQEFMLLYESFKKGIEYEPEPLRIGYRDYAVWHNRLLADERQMKAAREFWKSQLSGEIAALQLPYDRAKTDSISDISAGYRMVIPADICQPLREIANERKASLYMVLLTGFKLLLFRVTGQQNILVGFPGAGRQHDDLKEVIGLFVNTLILRSRISPKETFNDILEQVQKNMMRVLDHQDFPLELICGELKIKYPEISTFFNMFTLEGRDKHELKDHESYHIGAVQDAKFDMVCYLSEYRNGVEIETHYKKELFNPITIEKMMQKYMKILADIASDREGEPKGHRQEQKRRINRFHGLENPKQIVKGMVQ